MTLVVCRKEDHEVFVQSDSKVIDSFGAANERSLRQNDMLGGLLKTVLIHPHICLSFSGASRHATKFLKTFMASDMREWGTRRLIVELFKIHRESGLACEFILCESVERSPRITLIKDGNVQVDQQSAWIGSQPAFNKYQESFHKLDASEPLNQRMRRAFREVIDDENLLEVGHFHIEVYLEHKFANTGLIGGGPDSVFAYEYKGEWDAGNQVLSIKANEATALPMGSAPYGAYGLGYFRSLSTKRQGVALHFPHASFGILMCPQVDCEKAIIFKDCVATEFLDQIWDTYQIALEGVAVVSETKFQHIRSGR
ncbi:hypothetical protein [Ponticoccus alexandrii]|uniref:Uncharacterized protein n=1 Tax=Ponticoccus alexandrii TaxID=1943633 RepID=A0ABX7F4I3_9RHOB|nr:hypothetical protein [Ponticoccus alexandrii]QRF65111.1 hypothetical protein GQA70_01555 [Ponticoccus alexandrii]